jgi:hypothetical protein
MSGVCALVAHADARVSRIGDNQPAFILILGFPTGVD